MRKITFKNKSLKDKVKLIGYLFFGKLSDNELKLTTALAECSNGGQFDLKSPELVCLKDKLKINDQTFAVTIHRLTSKKVISKTGSLVILHPILSVLADGENSFMINFDNEKTD